MWSGSSLSLSRILHTNAEVPAAVPFPWLAPLTKTGSFPGRPPASRHLAFTGEPCEFEEEFLGPKRHCPVACRW